MRWFTWCLAPYGRGAGNRIVNFPRALQSFFFSLRCLFQTIRLVFLEHPADHDVFLLDGHQLLACQRTALGIQAIGLAQARTI